MTVYRARARALVLEGMEAALQRKPRPPVPPKLDGAAQAELVRLACSPPPGRAHWDPEAAVPGAGGPGGGGFDCARNGAPDAKKTR